MKFICDVHIPYKLVLFFHQNGYEAIHVNHLPHKDRTTDIEIARYADQNNLVVVTKGEDFERLHFIKSTPKKLLRIILGNISYQELILLFEKYMPVIIRSVQNEQKFYLEMGKERLLITLPDNP